MRAYFEKFIYGTAPLEEPLSKALAFMGCQLVTEENASVSEGTFGFRAVTRDGRTEVLSIWPNSPAATSLTVDDEIVAVNGRRVAQNLQTLLAAGANQYELSVFRQNQLRTVTLAADSAARYWQKITVARLPAATEEQRASFQQWLKQVF